MGDLGEQFGANLVRVIKKVKRRSPDGGVQVVKQAFHVRKAKPEDEYSSGSDRKSKIPPLPKGFSSNKPILQQNGPEQSQDEPEAQPEPLPPRMLVRYHDIPWLKKKTKAEVEKEDPIPAGVRKRYDKGNRVLQATNPNPASTPVFSVMPTDRILWGVDEPDLLMDLRAGYVRKMIVVKQKSGLMLSKIEAPRGGSYTTYIWLESLREPVLKSIWGGLVDLENDGALAKRSSSAYEAAKACGLDDVVPPTVHRFDEEGDLVSVLPDDLVEQADRLVEWVSRETGSNPDDVRKRLGGHATIQLVRDRLWTVSEEEWFKSIFDEGSEEKDVLNRIWDYLPGDRRISLLRIAMFDFVVWNMDRSIGDLAFCDNPKHPVVSYGNELSVPCSYELGKRYAESGAGAYSEIPATPSQGRPMLWNDVMSMLSVRGGDAEFDVCEKIGYDIAGRMKNDRPLELSRSLIERGLTPLQVGGVLSRIWMLATHAKEVAKDPYFAPRYYASLIQGSVPAEYKGFAEFVDQSMARAALDDFSFADEIRSGGKKDEDR